MRKVSGIKREGESALVISETFKMIRALGKAVDVHLLGKRGDFPITLYAYPIEDHLVLVLPAGNHENAEQFFEMLEDLRQSGPGAPIDKFLGLGDIGMFHRDKHEEGDEEGGD